MQREKREIKKHSIARGQASEKFFYRKDSLIQIIFLRKHTLRLNERNWSFNLAPKRELKTNYAK